MLHLFALIRPGDAWHAMRKTLEGVFNHESVDKCSEEAKRYPMNTCTIFCPLIFVSCIIFSIILEYLSNISTE